MELHEELLEEIEHRLQLWWQTHPIHWRQPRIRVLMRPDVYSKFIRTTPRTAFEPLPKRVGLKYRGMANIYVGNRNSGKREWYITLEKRDR